jgi:hypothetical protein
MNMYNHVYVSYINIRYVYFVKYCIVVYENYVYVRNINIRNITIVMIMYM